MWPAALGLMFTASYNVLQVVTPLRWLGLDLSLRGVATWVALLNVALLVHLVWISASTPSTLTRRSVTRLLKANRVVAGVLVLAIGLTLLMSNLITVRTAVWMAQHIDTYAKFAVERSAVQTSMFATDWPRSANWKFDTPRTIESKAVADWYNSGSHYLLIDESTMAVNFQQRIQALEANGATLRYQSQGLPNLIPRQAILWSFTPQHKLNVVFDGALTCIGYTVIRGKDGRDQLLMH
jgi:hypothetical protein